jgi:hypothetical protein
MLVGPPKADQRTAGMKVDDGCKSDDETATAIRPSIAFAVDKATGGYTIALATVDCGKQLTSIALKADDAKIVLRKTPAEIAPYPPMQWHSWGLFTHEGLITEANMLEMAEALISSGMAAAGYSTVNVVCNGWVGRDPTTGVLQENHTSWPNGMASFARKLHAITSRLS